MANQPQISGQHWSILVADSDEQSLQFFRKLLESSPEMDFTLHHCTTPAEVQDCVTRHAVDVFFLDLTLAADADLTDLESLASQFPHLPILVMTGVENQHLGIRAIKGGAQDCLVRSNLSPSNIWRIIRYAAERKRTQDSLISHLRSSPGGRDLFRTVVDEAPEAILVVDQDSLVHYANAAAARCLHTARDSLENALCPLRIAPDELCERDLHIDGELRTLEVQAVSAPWGDTPAYVVALRDVTVERRRQRERDAMDPETQRTQAAESLACLAGGIAHDYRNLLMGILGNASLALMEVGEDSPLREYLEHIRQTARKASNLTNKMLTYSGRSKFDFNSVDLAAVVTDMKSVIEPSSPTHVTLEYNLPDTLPPLVADADHLRQALMNLLLNAWEAMDDRPGTVRIRTGQTESLRNEALTFSFVDREKIDRPFLWIEVEDDGPGIPPDLRQRIFDPFYSTKFAGRGLGLSTVQGTVRGHGGALLAASNPAGGARIRLYLPMQGRPAAKGADSGMGSPGGGAREGWTGEGRILVADDDPVVLDICRRYLRTHGFAVVTAIDGVEAVNTFQAEQKDIDAVILDLNMPRMDGREALRQIQAINPAIGIIISTGFAADDISDEFADLGISALLEKPYEPAPLLEAVHAAMRA